jgi:tRNA(Ile2) C34 agmatinyltransferase TiaS
MSHSSIECPKCRVSSDAKDWKESLVWCEDCGDHEGFKCPSCEEDFDHVLDDKIYFEIYNKKKLNK